MLDFYVFQFIVVVPGFLLSLALFMILGKFVIKSNHARKITLQVLATTLVIAEFVKIVYYVIISDSALPAGNLPFYLCSLFLVTFMINAFCTGKVSRFLLPLSFFGGLFAGVAQMIQPYVLHDLLIKDFNWIGIHSYLFHVVLIVFSVLLVQWKYYRPTFIGAVKAIIPIIVLGLIMVGVMQLIPDKTVNFFELGRTHSVFAPIFDAITYPVGIIVFFIVIFGIMVGIWGLYLLIMHINAALQKVYKTKE